MENLNNTDKTSENAEKELRISDVSCSFYDFTKNYIKIKDGANERSFNDVELKELEEMQQMMDKGYELRLVHLRKGSKIMWCKKNCN
jgi:hypothetical protein